MQKKQTTTSRPRYELGVKVLILTCLLGTVAMASEQPTFTLVSSADGIEVRDYAATVVAETVVKGEQTKAGNAAFGLLAGYIFGGNGGSRKIAMTAPVTQVRGEEIAMTAPVTQVAGENDSWRVRFTMPASWTLETLPVPNDPRVTIKVVPARRVAVVKYTGTWSQANYDEHLVVLEAAITKQGLQKVGSPVWARYDSPWTPWFLRTNEIQLELAP
jgi:hypothetical protein